MFKYIIVLSLLITAVFSDLKLPAEPSLPSKACSTLAADLTHSGDHLAEADESKPDTKRIQDALDKCAKGEAVKLTASGGKNAFLSGPLKLPSGVTLWVDKGATLFASRNPRDFDKVQGTKSCGVVASKEGGCAALITASDTTKSGVVGDGVIDGRGGATLTGGSKTWWDLGLDAKNNGGDQNNPRLVQINKGSDFLLYRITLQNAPKFHVVPDGVNGFIAWSVKIHTPTSAYSKYDTTTAKNTDGIDPTDTSNVVIAHSYISTGDDNVAVKSGSAKVSNVLIESNHFYKGHGMSIGSQTEKGVSNVIVRDLSLEGTDNGIRVKSDQSCGGLVTGVLFEKVCIKNVASPIVFDAHYSNKSGSAYPDFQGIKVSGLHILSSDKKEIVFRGYDAKYPLKVTLDNVVSDVKLDKLVGGNADITEGPGAVTNLAFDSSVKLSGKAGTSTPIDCSKAFVSFP